MIKLDYYDFVVIHREIDKRIVELIKKARKKRIKTIYSWDDNFFKFPAGFGNLSKYYNNYKRLNLLKIILKEVDLVKVTNKYLEAESKKYNHNTVIQKYTFDFSLLNGVNYCDEKMKSKEIHIGYFGNPGIDFEFVINAIIDISNEFPDVIFEFIGHIPNKIEKIKNYKIHEPIYDYPRAIKFLQV